VTDDDANAAFRHHIASSDTIPVMIRTQISLAEEQMRRLRACRSPFPRGRS